MRAIIRSFRLKFSRLYYVRYIIRENCRTDNIMHLLRKEAKSHNFSLHKRNVPNFYIQSNISTEVNEQQESTSNLNDSIKFNQKYTLFISFEEECILHISPHISKCKHGFYGT